MSDRYRLIHVQDKEGGAVFPLIIKSYKAKKLSKGKPLMLGKKEVMKNARHISAYGGWIVPALSALATVPGIISGFRDLFRGKGLDYNPNDIPRSETNSQEPFIKSVVNASVARGIKYKKGGRIFLGSGIKKIPKMVFEGPFDSVSAGDVIPDLKGQRVPLYRLK